ncbi:MAG TPA: PIN domain-containing protein [Nitrososphaerales archaeon]|nr:PIN domain-containing protein [Nitrososphaerales archaeon]
MHREGTDRLSAVVTDTDVLVFDTSEDSEFHAQAASGLDSIGKWCIPGMAFHEFLWFFKGTDLPLSQARTKAEEYLTNEKSLFAPCTPEDVRFATRLMKGYHDYNDPVILSVAERMGLPPLSFDEALKKMAAKNSVGLFERPRTEQDQP